MHSAKDQYTFISSMCRQPKCLVIQLNPAVMNTMRLKQVSTLRVTHSHVEHSYSPTSKEIVFTSHRLSHQEPSYRLTCKEITKQQFEKCLSEKFCSLWIKQFLYKYFQKIFYLILHVFDWPFVHFICK